MNQKRLNWEVLFYAIAFLLALTVRLVHLGGLPLTNRESLLALQAMQIAHGQNPILDPYPAYLALTTAWMFMFSASNWVARFWPAMAGSLLVLLPLLFRDRLGRLPAVLLAFFLVFDPGMLAVSRQAGSVPLALLFTLLALGLWWKEQPLLAGVSAGLAMLSGPAVWPGAAALALAIWISGTLFRQPARASIGFSDRVLQRGVETESVPPRSAHWRLVAASALTAIFLVGTLFFTIPDGLSAMASSLTTYLRGWVQPSGVSASLLLMALLTYEFLPLLFGLWGAVVGMERKNNVDGFLVLWFALALAFALAYPARSPADITWSLLPLWALAARQMARIIKLPAFERAPVIGQSLLSGVILAYVSLTFVGMFNSPVLSTRESWIRLGGALIMLVASTGLVAWGWSRLVALRGLAAGIFLVMVAYFFAAGWNAAGLSSRIGPEIWADGRVEPGQGLMLQTIADLNQWGPRETGGLDVVVVSESSPALRWALRGVERLSFVDYLPAEANPAIVITPSGPELALAATYRGQGFQLFENTQWSTLSAADWFRWVVFRTLPVDALAQNHVILWARLDLFPEGQGTPTETGRVFPDQNKAPQSGQENPR